MWRENEHVLLIIFLFFWFNIKGSHYQRGGGDTVSGRWEIGGQKLWEVGDEKTMWEVGDWCIKCGRCDLGVLNVED